METTTVTIRVGGIELNTKTKHQLKQASVSVEKVICCCDEPVPVLAFGELGGGEGRKDGGGSACWQPDLAAEGKARCLDVLFSLLTSPRQHWL